MPSCAQDIHLAQAGMGVKGYIEITFIQYLFTDGIAVVVAGFVTSHSITQLRYFSVDNLAMSFIFLVGSRLEASI